MWGWGCSKSTVVSKCSPLGNGSSFTASLCWITVIQVHWGCHWGKMIFLLLIVRACTSLNWRKVVFIHSRHPTSSSQLQTMIFFFTRHCIILKTFISHLLSFLGFRPSLVPCSPLCLCFFFFFYQPFLKAGVAPWNGRGAGYFPMHFTSSHLQVIFLSSPPPRGHPHDCCFTQSKSPSVLKCHQHVQPMWAALTCYLSIRCTVAFTTYRIFVNRYAVGIHSLKTFCSTPELFVAVGK